MSGVGSQVQEMSPMEVSIPVPAKCSWNFRQNQTHVNTYIHRVLETEHHGWVRVFALY